MYSSIAPARRTAGDALGLLVAALLVGDFELARRAVPADPAEREQPMQQLDELLVQLLIARPGDPEAVEMAARVHALAARVIDPDETHRVVLSTYRGLADQRSGKAASAAAHYAPHVEHACMWPWHRMVLAEAYRAIGNEVAARVVLIGVAERVGGSEYWRELATRQLQATPYR